MDSPSADSPAANGSPLDSMQVDTMQVDSMQVDRPTPPRGSVWLAWLVILATIGVILFPGLLKQKLEAVDPSIILLEIQARYLVGASTVSFDGKEQLKNQLAPVFGKGSLRQRLIGAVLLGELMGPGEAATSLSDLEQQVQDGRLTVDQEDDRKALGLLQQIQAGLIEKTPLSDSQSDEELATGRALLAKRLGWVGKLAYLPPGSPDRAEREQLLAHAQRTLFVMVGTFGLAAVAAAVGFLLQILWWVFAASGRLKSGIPPLSGDGAIYAETFAAWMVLFVVLNLALMYLPLPKWGLVWVLIPQIGSLGALAWPLFRGLRWSDVRQDLGLTLGEQPWSIPFIGVGAYLSALPVLGLAMVVTALLMAFMSQFAGNGEAAATPIHPIVEPILRGNWTLRLQLLFVAVFAAVPEEIMFRGALYRHLREAKTQFGYICGVAFAAILSSFVFAVIHPQGLFGIPILMSLAMVFALVREWRGSIYPVMITHALVNAGTSTLLLLIAD